MFFLRNILNIQKREYLKQEPTSLLLLLQIIYLKDVTLRFPCRLFSKTSFSLLSLHGSTFLKLIDISPLYFIFIETYFQKLYFYFYISSTYALLKNLRKITKNIISLSYHQFQHFSIYPGSFLCVHFVYIRCEEIWFYYQLARNFILNHG